MNSCSGKRPSRWSGEDCWGQILHGGLDGGSLGQILDGGPYDQVTWIKMSRVRGERAQRSSVTTASTSFPWASCPRGSPWGAPSMNPGAGVVSVVSPAVSQSLVCRRVWNGICWQAVWVKSRRSGSHPGSVSWTSGFLSLWRHICKMGTIAALQGRFSLSSKIC